MGKRNWFSLKCSFSSCHLPDQMFQKLLTLRKSTTLWLHFSSSGSGFNLPFEEFSCLNVFLLSEMSVVLALRTGTLSTVSQPLTYHTVLDASSSSESAQTSVSSHHFPSFFHSKMLSFHHICCLWVHNTDWLLAKQCISFLTCKWDNISGMMENIDRKARMWSLN